MIKRIRQNYHWVVAFLVFLQMIVFGGLLNSASVYIIPISETLGVTRGSYSLATIPYSITCTVGTMVSGYLFQKFGYKKSAIVSLILITLSLVLTATCKTIWGFCFSKIMGLRRVLHSRRRADRKGLVLQASGPGCGSGVHVLRIGRKPDDSGSHSADRRLQLARSQYGYGSDHGCDHA